MSKPYEAHFFTNEINIGDSKITKTLKTYPQGNKLDIILNRHSVMQGTIAVNIELDKQQAQELIEQLKYFVNN